MRATKTHSREVGSLPGELADRIGTITQWLNRIRSGDPIAIVTMARKGTRLIEVLSEFIAPDSLPRDRVTSNLALPFEPQAEWRDHMVPVVDDIVIWGTGMRAQAEELTRKGIHPALFALALDDDHAGWVSPDSVVTTAGSATTAFCDSVVRAIGLLNKPYDVEYPIIYHSCYFTRNEFSFRNLPDGARINHLTMPSQEESGLMHATVDDLPVPVLGKIVLPGLASTFGPIRKLRLYGSIDDGEMAVAPMFIINWAHVIARSCQRGQVFQPPLAFLNELVRDAADLAATNNGGRVERMQLPLSRVCTYLTNYVLGIRFAPILFNEMTCGSARGTHQGTVSAWDLQLLFGRYLGTHIFQSLQAHHEELSEFAKRLATARIQEPRQASLLDWGGQSAQTSPDDEECVEIGMREHWKLFESEVKERLASSTEPHRCVLEVFKVMRNVYDIQTRAPENYSPERLRLGLTFTGLQMILHRNGRSISSAKLSACIDFLIDAGAVVPFSLLSPLGVVHRVFRFGEDLFTVEKAPYAVRETLDYCINTRGESNISHFRFDKTMAFLKCTLDKPWRRGDVFVNLYWDRYGARTEFATPGRRSTLQQFCTNERIARFKGRGGPDSDTDIELNPEFERLHPGSECPLSQDKDIPQLQNMVELFRALTTGERDYNYTLALTTCFDADSTIQALRAEIDGWLDNPELGIQNVIGFLAGRGTSDQEKLEDLVWRMPVFAKQIGQKHAVFSNLSKHLKHFDAKFDPSDRGSRVLGNLWRQSKGYFSDGAPRIQKDKLQALHDISELFGWLSSILQHFLNRSFGKRRKLSLRGHEGMDLVQCIAAYNGCLEQMRRRQPEFFPVIHYFPVTVGDSRELDGGQQALVVEALRYLREDVQRWVRNLDAVRTSQEIGLGSTFLVAYDCASSSDAAPQRRNELIREVNKELKEFLGRLPDGVVVDFPDRPDDGQHVLLQDLGYAWSVANFIRTIEGAHGARARVAIFDAIGPDELFLDPYTQKPDGDAHVYVARMLPFTDQIDGTAIIATKSVFEVLKEDRLIDPKKKIKPLGRRDVKGLRLRDIDLVIYQP